MITYQCPKCNRIFDRKFNYDRHINDNKRPCIFINQHFSQILQKLGQKRLEDPDFDDDTTEFKKPPNSNICLKCNKNYSTKFNLNKHMKKCQVIMKNGDVDDQKEAMYKERIAHLESQVIELTKKIGNTYSYQINQHLDQSVHQQNIQINSYGNENLNYITPSEVEKLISHPSTCLPQFIKMVHYHEEHPENHNVVIGNIKENVIKTLKEKNSWQFRGLEEFVERFAIEKYDQLCDLYNSDEVNVDEVIRDKFEKWADQFDYVESHTRKKAEEDAKLAIIMGSQWLMDKKITKRGLKRILDGEMRLNDEDMLQFEKIKQSVGWGVPTPVITEVSPDSKPRPRLKN